MPIGNNFQHAAYSRSDPGDRVVYQQVRPSAPPDSAAWLDEMARLGAQLTAARVRAVVFLNGSAFGTDLFGAQRLDEVGGLKRGYSRGIPGMEALLALMRQETNGVPPLRGMNPPLPDDEAARATIDDQARDAGNFTAAYVELFRKAVNRQAARPIVCRRSLWSSEHHHLGRARAACRFLEHVRAIAAEQHLGPGDRILVQAHGQAGQILALASNLLAPVESSGRKTFLKVLAACGGAEHVHRLEELIQNSGWMNGAALDVVTFGTAVRYGWDPSGIGQLLHIVNHRPMRADGKRWLAKMELPQITMEMPIAWGGDYVQQLAVAGTDAATPAPPEEQTANKTLWELLEPYDGFERWLECARKTVRCPSDGHCLLVDYQDSTGSTNPLDHLYGHAAYTRLSHLLFNTTEIVKAFYTSNA